MAEDTTGELNLQATLSTTLALLNESPPITNSQFEIWYSEWPRLKWLAQGVRVPGLESKTIPIFFSGFQVPVVINTTYEGDMSLQMDILADEYGQYYAHWRNSTIFYSMDKQKGKPILGGGLNEVLGVYQGQRYLVVKLVNDANSPLQHCWRFHNFKVTGVGEIEMNQSGGDLVTFTVTGIFTHISYTQQRNNAVILGGVASAYELTPETPAPTGTEPEQPPAQPPAAPTLPTPELPPETPPEPEPGPEPEPPAEDAPPEEPPPSSNPLFPPDAISYAENNNLPNPYEPMAAFPTDEDKAQHIQDLKNADQQQKDALQDILGAPPKDNQYLVGDCVMTMGPDGIELTNTKTGVTAKTPPNITPSLDTEMNSALDAVGIKSLSKQEDMISQLEYLRAARIAANGGADVDAVQGLYQGSKLEEAAAAVTDEMKDAAMDNLNAMQSLGFDIRQPEDIQYMKDSLVQDFIATGTPEAVAAQVAKQAVEQVIYNQTHQPEEPEVQQDAETHSSMYNWWESHAN